MYDRRRAVALRAEFDPAIARRDDEKAIGCEDAASDHPQAVAERAAHRQPQQLGRDHWPGDAEQPGDLFRLTFDSAAVVLDEVAAIRQFADADLGSGVERVVGQFFQNQTRGQRGGLIAGFFECPAIGRCAVARSSAWLYCVDSAALAAARSRLMRRRDSAHAANSSS